MYDRRVTVLEQKKLILRGLERRGKNALLKLDGDETLNVAIDWATWLGSDTIASATNTVTGVSVSNEANTTTQVSFNVSASCSGWIESRITTANGLKAEMLILVQVDGFPVRDDYGIGWRLT